MVAVLREVLAEQAPAALVVRADAPGRLALEASGDGQPVFFSAVE